MIYAFLFTPTFFSGARLGRKTRAGYTGVLLEHLHKGGRSEDLGVDGIIVNSPCLIVSPFAAHLPHTMPASAGHSVAAVVVRTTTTESQIINRVLKMGNSMWTGCI